MTHDEIVSETIEAAIPERGPMIASEIATKVVDSLRSHHPDALAGWLDRHAVRLFTEHLSTMLRSRRSIASRDRDRVALRDAADRFDKGDETALNVFAERMCVDEAKTWLPIGEMTAAHHRFVADRYADSAKTSKLLAAFHRQVAKLIPAGGTTADVLSEDEYLRIRAEMFGRALATAN